LRPSTGEKITASNVAPKVGFDHRKPHFLGGPGGPLMI
jgi:hypothetical protein